MAKKMTTQDFITKAIMKHGDRWDYTDTEYFGNSKSVAIRCRDHGVFTPLANDHLSKLAGCPDCAGVRRLTTPEFIDRGNKVHGTFDYSKVIYKNTDTKVILICKEMHEFSQTPHDHLQGVGCPHCAGLSPITFEGFLKKAAVAHPSGYDYSLVRYERYTKSKIEIICKFHSKSFWQTPQAHCEGHGCPICGGVEFIPTSEFVSRSVDIHGTKYKYHKSVYAGKATPLCIECPTHGDFWQKPMYHFNGAGCPRCAEYGFDANLDAIIYVLDIDGCYAGFGITNDFKTRLTAHKTTFRKYNATYKVITTFEISGKYAQRIETSIKQKFNTINTGMEGFKTEAIGIQDAPKLLDFINDELKKL